MKKTAIIIMIITVLSKIIGFGREIVLSYYFGASSVTDAYLISLTIPRVIFGFIGYGIVTAYIPMHSAILKESSEKESNLYTSNLSNIVLILTTIILALGMVYADYLVEMFAMGFTGATLLMAIDFTRFSLWGMYFTGLNYIFSGFLQMKNNFIVPALIGFPLNLVIIISIVIASKGNHMALALGTVIASAAQLIFMIPFLKKAEFKYSFKLNFKDKNIIKTFFLAMPAIIGTSVNQINILIDKTIASSLMVGGISALNYADRLNIFIQGIFVSSIITAIYPSISKNACDNDYNNIKDTLVESASIVSLVIIPGAIGAMVFSTEIVDLLFGRGRFDNTALIMTSSALFYYSIGMLGYGMRDVISRGFYAIQDTKTPMINASIGVFVNISLDIILSRFMGIGGLALATSISAIVTSILLYISIQKKIGRFKNRELFVTMVKILGASVIMGIISRLSYIFILQKLNESLSLIIAVLMGVIVYVIIIILIKIPIISKLKFIDIKKYFSIV